MRPIMHHVRRTIFSLLVLTLFLLPFGITGFAQAPPDAGLQLLTVIRIPDWITSNAVGPTANVASYDVPSFNRVTGVMYVADRVHFGISAIDTKALRYLGTIEPPGCRQNPKCSPSGALVAPDLQKLIVTDRDLRIFIYDLRAPAQSPTVLVSSQAGVDELDYDPINQRAYIGHNPGNLVTVVDVAKNTILGDITVPDAVEQPRFNPVDGMIYVNIPGTELTVIDPGKGSFGAVVNRLMLPGKPGDCANAIDIDPVSDTAFLGCSAGPQGIMDLKTGNVLATFPFTGGDVGYFNPHLRRFYMATDNRNTPAAQRPNCPNASDGRTGALLVYSNSPTPNTLVGVACGGRGHAVAAVDPINNNVFYFQVQYPPDASSANSGAPGILVYHDPAPGGLGVPAGTEQALTHATLSAVGGSGVQGSVDFSLRRRNMDVEATLTGLQPGSTSTFLVITTSAGNETINCGVNGSGSGFCAGSLVGDPLIGGVADVGQGGVMVSQGTITSVSTIPTYISIDAFQATE